MDCDNDHSDIPADWITLEDIAEFFADVPYVLHFSHHHEKPKGEKVPDRDSISLFGLTQSRM